MLACKVGVAQKTGGSGADDQHGPLVADAVKTSRMKAPSSGHVWHGPAICRTDAISTTSHLVCKPHYQYVTPRGDHTPIHDNSPSCAPARGSLERARNHSERTRLMSYLLHIDSSSLGEASVSRQVAQSFLEGWRGDVAHRTWLLRPCLIYPRPASPPAPPPRSVHAPRRAEAAATQDALIEEVSSARAPISSRSRCTT